MIRSLLVLGLLVGCGGDEGFKAPKLPSSVTVDGAADYFTDRNFTGEDFQNFQNTTAGQVDDGYVDGKQAAVDGNITGEDFQKGTNKIASDTDKGYVDSKEKVEASYEDADDKIAASKHKAAGYTGDRNITGDAFSKQFSDYESKVVRKGEITKGYTSDRLDQIKDPDRKEREQIKALQSEQDRIEAEALADRLRLEKEAADALAKASQEAADDLAKQSSSSSDALAKQAQDSADALAKLAKEASDALAEQVRIAAEDRARIEQEAADRMALIEAVNDLQDVAIQAARDYADSQDALQTIALTGLIDDLEDYVDTENSDQDTEQLALARRVFRAAKQYADNQDVAQSIVLNRAISDLEDYVDTENSDQDTEQLALARRVFRAAKQYARNYADLKDQQLESRVNLSIAVLRDRVSINEGNISDQAILISGLTDDIADNDLEIADLLVRMIAAENDIQVLQADVNAVCSVAPGTIDVDFTDNSYHYDHTVTLQDNTAQKCIDVNHDGRRGRFPWNSGTPPSTEQVCFQDTDKYQDISWNFHLRTDTNTLQVPIQTVVCPSSVVIPVP